MPARSVAHISVTNHAAHLIHLPYQIMLAMIDVHGKEWVCKAVRQPFFSKNCIYTKFGFDEHVH